MEAETKLELLELRVTLLEKELLALKKDVHKIVYILAAVLLVEGPQAVSALKILFGF